MIQFSIPTALSIFAATSAVAVTSMAVALPTLQSSEPSVVAPTSSVTVTPSPTSSTPTSQVIDSPLSAFGNHEVGNGIMLQDLPMGLAANVRPSGVTFSYVGTCTGDGPGTGAAITVWGNNGQQKSLGSAGYCNGGLTFASMGMVWSEDTRNSYCSSPLGGASAYRAEVFGQFSEWVSIPAEYMQCPNGQAPEGPATVDAVPSLSPELPGSEPTPPVDDSPSPTQ